MKEVPEFRYGDKSYDLSFNDDFTGIYCVKDKISGVLVSQLIMAANDYVAVQGFKNFVDKRSEEHDGNVYQLIKVGDFCLDGVFIAENKKLCLFNSSDDLQSFLDSARSFLVSIEED